MIAFIKSIVDRILIISHHGSCAISGAVSFGFAAYLLDLGGFRSTAHMRGGIDHKTLTAAAIVLAVFCGADMLMKRLTGKHGAF